MGKPTLEEIDRYSDKVKPQAESSGDDNNAKWDKALKRAWDT